MDRELIKKVQELRKNGKSFGEISKELLITKSNACYCNKINLEEYDEKKSSYQKYVNRVCELAEKCTNINQILHILGKKGTNEYYKQIRKILTENNIDTSHFKEYEPYKPEGVKNKIPIEKYLIKGSTITISNLREKLLKEGIKEHKCENPECGLTEWHGKPIPLQLHHINGDRTDNRLENLQLLCPNCHALTDNYCGRKLKKPKTTKQKPSKIVPKEQLLNDFKEFGTFSGVGKKYGVSDKAVVKWCGKYNLPIHSIDMRKYVREFFGENIKWNITNGNAETLRNISFFRKKCLIDDDNNIIKIYSSQKEIEEDGFSASKVNEVCKGIRKTHKNRKFVFYETD